MILPTRIRSWGEKFWQMTSLEQPRSVGDSRVLQHGKQCCSFSVICYWAANLNAGAFAWAKFCYV